jgi:hypothetical protein
MSLAWVMTTGGTCKEDITFSKRDYPGGKILLYPVVYLFLEKLLDMSDPVCIRV